MTTATKQVKIHRIVNPLTIGQKSRLLIWKEIKGIWKNRKPEPLKELNKIRREWK